MNTKFLWDEGGIVLVMIAVVLIGGGGYIANLYKLIHESAGVLSSLLRLIGVFFPPLGALLGFV